MVSGVDAVKTEPTVPLTTTPTSVAQAGMSFASELASVMVQKKERKKETNSKPGEKKELAGKLLESLKVFSDLEYKLQQLQGEANPADSASLEELFSLLSEIKQAMMSGIKASVNNLEQALRNRGNKIPAESAIQFQGEINEIKSAFKTGFGLDFDSYEPAPATRPLEELVKKLYQKRASLPAALAEKIEALAE